MAATCHVNALIGRQAGDVNASALHHLLQRVASAMLLPSEPGQGGDCLPFARMTVATDPTRRPNPSPFPEQHPVVEQGRQDAQQIEAIPVGVRDGMGQPNLIGKQVDLKRLGSRRGHNVFLSTMLGGRRQILHPYSGSTSLIYADGSENRCASEALQIAGVEAVGEMTDPTTIASCRPSRSQPPLMVRSRALSIHP